MRLLFSLLIFCLLLPACGKESVVEKSVYDFAESILIIRHLIKSDSLPQILEDAELQGLERIINNFSPAQMALESEVLNCTLPVLLYFYQNSFDTHLLEQLAKEYENKIKIVIIDADQFFSISEQFEVHSFPTVIALFHREEIERIESCSCAQKEQVKNIMMKLANQTKNI